MTNELFSKLIASQINLSNADNYIPAKESQKYIQPQYYLYR